MTVGRLLVWIYSSRQARPFISTVIYTSGFRTSMAMTMTIYAMSLALQVLARMSQPWHPIPKLAPSDVMCISHISSSNMYLALLASCLASLESKIYCSSYASPSPSPLAALSSGGSEFRVHWNSTAMCTHIFQLEYLALLVDAVGLLGQSRVY
ncbi:hypothetical protein GALMADRAFT_265131 [Galerina marginata CBS 339.88]|uniref:Uncharacterized protein n=1 Tax=Galerina marginata (strain CBS 339.88) TaxID=685588 RepID=A0A067TLS2_GALM3|nr:hypothetical protein GALMADRAFT_265131 [Galerina marginata CBS 339.88]